MTAADLNAEPQMLTQWEQNWLAALNKEYLLAGIDTPDDLTDDKKWAGYILEFWDTKLRELRSKPGTPSEWIVEAANQYNSAKSLMDQLNGATDNSPDLLAQIAQLQARADASSATAFASQQELAVFKGAGTIGSGGVDAYSATAYQPPVGSGSGTAGSPNSADQAYGAIPAGWYLTQVTSPEGQRVVGEAANSFNAGQGYVPSPREITGA